MTKYLFTGLLCSIFLLTGCKSGHEPTYTFILKQGSPVTYTSFKHYTNHTVVGDVKGRFLTRVVSDSNVAYVVTNL